MFTSRIDGSAWIDAGSTDSLMRQTANLTLLYGCGNWRHARNGLLRAMPVLPLFFDSYCDMQKPFVGGMTKDVPGVPQFKTAWIDTNWRAS